MLLVNAFTVAVLGVPRIALNSPEKTSEPLIVATISSGEASFGKAKTDLRFIPFDVTKLAFNPFQVLPHGHSFLPSSTDPNAALSHSAAVGSRFPAHNA